MRTLFGYEMRKIWKRPLLWAVIAVTAAALCISQVRDLVKEGAVFSARWESADGTVETGEFSQSDRFRLKVEGSRALAGLPMDEAFFQRAKEEIPLDADRDTLESWFCLEGSAWWECCSSWSEWLEGTAAEFYGAREDGIRRELQRESADVQAFWQAMEEKVEKPFVWQPAAGITRLLHSLGNGGLALLIPLLCGICLCDLFSQERRHSMESIIFSTRRGRSVLFRAKLLAGVCSGVLLVLLTALPVILVSLALYGTWGWNGALQLHSWSRFSSLPITLGQGLLILLGLLLVYAFLAGALISLLSVLSGDPLPGLIVSAAMVLLSMVQFRSLDWAILLPCNLVDQTVLSSHKLASFFGLHLTAMQTGALLYLGLGLLFWLAASFLWHRRAVRAGRN